MSIYSVKLGAAAPTATGTVSLFTAAAGVTTIIRDLSGVALFSTGSSTLFLLINGAGYWSTGTLSFLQGYHLECRIVLEPGDIVSLDGAAGFGSMYVSGYTLA